VTNYSPRFSFKGMSGTFPASVITGMKSVTGTDGPDREDATSDSNSPVVQPEDGDFDLAYTMQTGPTRYAPMQPVPPTKITKKDATPLYPTSVVDIAMSILAIAKQQTTITKSQTFSAQSRENTVCGLSPLNSGFIIIILYILVDGRCAGFRLIHVTGRRRSYALRRHGQVPQSVEGLSDMFQKILNRFLVGTALFRAFRKDAGVCSMSK